MNECKLLDRLFVTLCPDNTKPGWSYEIVEIEADPDDLVYSGKYHIYENEICHQTWNGIRCMRILLHEMILEASQKKLSSSIQDASQEEWLLDQVASSKQTLFEMQENILSSVPQSLGYTPTNGKAASSGKVDGSYNEHEKHTFPWLNFGNTIYDLSAPTKSSALPWVRVWGGYTILWPLYAAGSMETASEASRQWSIKALRRYAQQTGARQGTLFANALEDGRDLRR